eukprot:g45330.t1
MLAVLCERLVQTIINRWGSTSRARNDFTTRSIRSLNKNNSNSNSDNNNSDNSNNSDNNNSNSVTRQELDADICVSTNLKSILGKIVEICNVVHFKREIQKLLCEGIYSEYRNTNSHTKAAKTAGRHIMFGAKHPLTRLQVGPNESDTASSGPKRVGNVADAILGLYIIQIGAPKYSFLQSEIFRCAGSFVWGQRHFGNKTFRTEASENIRMKWYVVIF